MFVSGDKSQAVVYYFIKLSEPNAPLKTLRLKGLDTDGLYKINGEETCGGDELMNAGLLISPVKGDFQSIRFILKKIEQIT